VLRKPLFGFTWNVSLHRHHGLHVLCNQYLVSDTLRQIPLDPTGFGVAKAVLRQRPFPIHVPPHVGRNRPIC
jgi:hypothetical protein